MINYAAPPLHLGFVLFGSAFPHFCLEAARVPEIAAPLLRFLPTHLFIRFQWASHPGHGASPFRFNEPTRFSVTPFLPALFLSPLLFFRVFPT